MSGVNQFLKERLREMGGKTYIAPDIPEKKLTNAINSFKFNGDASSIIGICDNSAFSNAKEGFILSGLKIVYKGILQDPVEILYENISSVEYVVNIETNDKGKEKKTELIRFDLKDGSKVEVSYASSLNLSKLAEIVNSVTSEFDGYAEQSQMQPIDELSEDLKLSYIKVVVNMAFDNDGEVDDSEFSEILQLMTRLKLSVESRDAIRQYIGNPDKLESLESLVDSINAEAPDGMLQSLHISLVKDLISVNSSLSGSGANEFDFLQKNRNIFNVTDEEIELAEMAIANDRKILDRSYTDTAITASLKELGAKAGAVGVPLGAVYLSGSVMGMSAAGMTSGLASLGMGGMLGLSGMATGIGVAVVLGVIAYKGIKHLAGTGIDEGDKRREIMLQEVIRQSQRTINMVIQDINYLSKELSSALASDHVNEQKLQILSAKISQYVRASKLIGTKTEQAESDRARLKSPEILDIPRLKMLTKDHDKSKYFDFIIRFYVEDIQRAEKDGEVIETTVLRLKKGLDSSEFYELGQVFELLDYSSTQSAIKGKLKGMFA